MGTRTSAYIETTNSSGRKIRLVLSCGACAHGNDPMTSPRSPCISCFGSKSKFKLDPAYKNAKTGEVEVEYE